MFDTLPHIYTLIGLMIIGSVIAIETRDLLSTVISIGAVGFLLSLVYLMLGAPDLAITQVVVEIIVLVTLIRLTVTRDDTTVDEHRDVFALGSGLVFGGFLLAASLYCLQDAAGFGKPLMIVSQGYLDNSLEMTGAANVVMAVLLDYRAYDTLGEATVIFAAILGAYVVLRRIGRKHDAGDVPHS
jgi:multicomponent Na+:H+ antiporter subunit B